MTSRRSRILLDAALLAVLAAALLPGTPGRAAATVEIDDVAAEAGIAPSSKTWSANVGDANGDGWDDLLIVWHGFGATLYLNNTDGTFRVHQELIGRPTVVTRDRHDCDFADINADGRTDFYCNLGADFGTGEKTNEVWIQGEDGFFTDQVATFGAADPFGRGRWMTFINANGDAYPDLFVGTIFPRQDEHDSPNRFYLNVGGTHFVEAPEWGITVEERAYCADNVDVDGDGWEDLVLCASKTLKIYRNLDGTGFADIAPALGVAEPARSAAASLADFDGDGDLDMVQMLNGTTGVRLRSPSGFSARNQVYDHADGRALPTGDFDGDGDVDFLVVDGENETGNAPDVLFLNNGDGTQWTPRAVPDPGGRGDHGAAIDYNHDGLSDFVVLNGNVSEPRNAGAVQLLTAIVAPNEPLSVSVTGPGSVTSEPSGISCAADCTESYDTGTPVTLTANAGAMVFTGWGGDCAAAGTAPTCQVTMDAARSVTAAFEVPPPPPEHTLTVTVAGSGSVTSAPAGISCGADCAQDYVEGTSVTLTAAPASGSGFTGWSGACAGTSPTCTLSMTGDLAATATFAVLPPPVKYTLTVTRVGNVGGAIRSTPTGINCGTDCTEPYNAGTTVTLSAKPKAGWTFSGWGGACRKAESADVCVLKMAANRNVTATYVEAD